MTKPPFGYDICVCVQISFLYLPCFSVIVKPSREPSFPALLLNQQPLYKARTNGETFVSAYWQGILLACCFVSEELFRISNWFISKIHFKLKFKWQNFPYQVYPISNFNEFCSETGLILSWGMKRRRFMFGGSFHFIKRRGGFVTPI